MWVSRDYVRFLEARVEWVEASRRGWARVARELAEDNDILRAELTELHDKYEQAHDLLEAESDDVDMYHNRLVKANREIWELREELENASLTVRHDEDGFDDLRAELTELAEEAERWREYDYREGWKLPLALARVEGLCRESDDLRAYATEAYEHGVSDGIDMGKGYGRQQGARLATVDTLRRVQLAVREMENGEYS